MDKINRLKNFFEKLWTEKFVFILFVILTITLSFFHEPWFDEFQALQISKAPLKDILFVIPHMEGHPPLWYFILKFTSLFTSNPELVIKIPNLIFSYLAIWLLIFKSPFPKAVKLSLPFTYFLFYQYTIISRPYSLLMLAVFLAAVCYRERNIHPIKYVLTLIFMSMISAYGLFIAFGLALNWLIDIWNKQNFETFVKSFVKDTRFYCLLSLFFMAVLTVIIMMPNKDAPATTVLQYAPFWQRALYYLLGLISDATIFNFMTEGRIYQSDIIYYYSIFAFLFGVLAWYYLITYFKKNENLRFFLLTVFLFTVFCLFTYIWPHHIGILTFLIIFSFWCTDNNDKDYKYYSAGALKLFIVSIIVIQIIWSLQSIYGEIKYDYSVGRKLAEFIKENSLDEYKIMSPWVEAISYYDDKGNELSFNDILVEKKEVDFVNRSINTNVQWIPTVVNPYFGKNVFYNFNMECPNVPYTRHSLPLDQYSEKMKELYIKDGTPDFLVAFYFYFNNKNETEFLNIYKYKSHFDKVVNDKNYVLFKKINRGKIWKGVYRKAPIILYVRKDLYPKFVDIAEDVMQDD